ncbi:ferrous iron transport protein B [Synechococcus sp. PCC 7335]|uniref:Fe(2+) transporter permease subunit FeoB n=1 Tax=Synechococcus sp. (strain ATCC 29403 / PCC 7335) TaxID=91464 RepID=UPI00017EBC90|nr:Fe(2+) transporter permease subunit FeoB [Synechococcus sp. PCC 7335]EDX84274.1 ferrous iron transport protein B [Synechococcus sp. PCC 7335]
MSNDIRSNDIRNGTIALVGNPNCGKTTLFNALTGANQRVGNWPGVTVERKEGRYQYGNTTVTVVDLPGVYSLDADEHEGGLDEAIACKYLMSNQAQVIVNIVDAANLERNLYLTSQILDMERPLIVALNMMDVAKEHNVCIDTEQLAARLGCPVIPLVASRGWGVDLLQRNLDEFLVAPQLACAQVTYPAVIEEALSALAPSRWASLHLLEYGERALTGSFVCPSITPSMAECQTLQQPLIQQRDRIHQTLGEDVDITLADSRYRYAHQLAQSVASRPQEISFSTSDKIDRIVLNRWLGIPIFLGVMYLLFMFSINVGSAFIDFFDIFFGTIFVDGLGTLLAAINAPEWIQVLLADGFGSGIQTVATFIPVIGCLFLFMAFLEDSGYMARAAFVMDRFMRFVGLPGKSFVPMMVGFGCNVPAIMATRTLESRRERILTILMNPFMSCGARLPVYALFAAAFFPATGQNIVFALYLIGMGMAVLTGLIMKHTLLQGKAVPFVMELPTYHLPTLKGVLIRTWERLKSFILRAGRVIVLMVMVLSLLNAIGTDGSFGHENRDSSVLSAASRNLTPAFAPMGLRQENWPATVGLFTGVFAKEAVVGTLDSLYTQLGESEAIAAGVEIEETAFSFFGNLGEAFATIPANLAELSGTVLDPLGLSVGDVSSPEVAASEQEVAFTTFGQMARRFDGQAGAFAYLLFVLMYFPCVAAMGAVYRETNAGWTVFVGLWTTGLAYWSAVCYYQIATIGRHPMGSLMWIAGLTGILVTAFVVMRVWPSRTFSQGLQNPSVR